MLEKQLVCSTSLTILVLFMKKEIGLLLKKYHLLQCWEIEDLIHSMKFFSLEVVINLPYSFA